MVKLPTPITILMIVIIIAAMATYLIPAGEYNRLSKPVFYPIMVPLFLAAGYDLLVPVAVIFGGTQLGTLSSFTNPFSTIIASNAAGVNWTDGLWGRILMFAASTGITIWYIVRYAQKIKKDPTKSIVFRSDGVVKSPYEIIDIPELVTPLPATALFIVLLLALYMVFTLFISSSSGMAVLTMPIIGALAIIVNVPGREIVNTYLYGMGIMGFMTPTGLILPSLALVNVSLKAWWKFIYPLLIMLFILCAFFLVIGIFR